MSKFTEDKLEQTIIELLQTEGITRIKDEQIKREIGEVQ